MSQPDTDKTLAAQARSQETRSFVRTVKAATRRKYTPEDKIRIVLEGFRREVAVNKLCRREGSSLTPTTRGPKSSWRRARRGLPVTACETPRSRRYGSSSGRTACSNSWPPFSFTTAAIRSNCPGSVSILNECRKLNCPAPCAAESGTSCRRTAESPPRRTIRHRRSHGSPPENPPEESPRRLAVNARSRTVPRCCSSPR